jgi:hypothetical protein
MTCACETGWDGIMAGGKWSSHWLRRAGGERRQNPGKGAKRSEAQRSVSNGGVAIGWLAHRGVTRAKRIPGDALALAAVIRYVFTGDEPRKFVFIFFGC